MNKKRVGKIFQNVFTSIVIVAFLAIFVVWLAKSFGVTSLDEIFSQLVTVKVSVILLVAFAMLNFLFAINLLHTSSIQSKKDRQIDRAKSEFIALVSHQLRTPLSAVNWYTESLVTEDLGKVNKKQKEYLDRIAASNRRMISLVNAILDVSRIELNTFVVQPVPTDIGQLLKETGEELRHDIDAKKITFEKHYESNLGTITIDPRYVRMILDNLLSNAIKYTPEGGDIHLIVTIEDNKLNITVSDTGYGIPKNERSKVFTKLYRGKNILDKDTDGTGLGLYIIKSIVDYAGGTITFESTENKGTTFFVAIPLIGPVSSEKTSL